MSSSKSSNAIADSKETDSVIKRIKDHIQGKTLGGLVALVPLIVTAIVIGLIIGYADGVVRQLPFVDGQPWDFYGIGLIVGAVIFYIVGMLTSVRPGRKTIDLMTTVVSNIPVVGTVYGATLQATTSLSAHYHFTRVVFVEWPREGMIAMGFVTGRARSSETGDTLVVVYIPTVPNPTSGNMALVIEDDVVETDISVEDAMKLVFSGGIVLPEAVSLARVPREQQKDFELIGRFQTDSE